MRKLYFLLPGTTGKFGGGGLWAELKTHSLAKQICDTEVVTYRQREKDCAFLTDMLPNSKPKESIFVIGWGFDVPKVISKLKGQNIIYHAHSADYGFDIPSDIPIITVSRNTMGYWGEKAANGLVYYLPNQIGDEFCDRQQPRDIDIVVQTRKSSEYLLKQLIPALQSRYRVEVVDSYVEDLAGLFNRSKIYLYDSAEYWATSGVTEGFGLPPLEALACGCMVFSSLNHGLSDFLDPGFNCQKIGCHSLGYDLEKIQKALSQYKPQATESLIAQYRSQNIVSKLELILTDINQFFDWCDRGAYPQDNRKKHQSKEESVKIKSLNNRRIKGLKIQKFWQKIQQKLKRK